MLIEFLRLLLMGCSFRLISIALDLYIAERGYFTDVPPNYGVIFNAIAVSPLILFSDLKNSDFDLIDAISLFVFLFLSLCVGGWMGQDIYEKCIQKER